jgi:hypothetical protein
VTTVVLQTSLANIEHVMIAGDWKKRDGKLAFPRLAEKKQALWASGHRILVEMGLAQAA